MPSQYLRILKIAHQTIAEALDSTQLSLRSSRETNKQLYDLREKLLSAFGQQDKVMIDALYAFYEGDRLSIKMIDFLVHDLKDIKIKFLIFFDKHTGEVWNKKKGSLSGDFLDFAAQIVAHLKSQEEYLFPLLEKMD